MLLPFRHTEAFKSQVRAAKCIRGRIKALYLCGQNGRRGEPPTETFIRVDDFCCSSVDVRLGMSELHFVLRTYVEVRSVAYEVVQVRRYKCCGAKRTSGKSVDEHEMERDGAACGTADARTDHMHS